MKTTRREKRGDDRPGVRLSRDVYEMLGEIAGESPKTLAIEQMTKWFHRIEPRLRQLILTTSADECRTAAARAAVASLRSVLEELGEK